MPVEIAEILGTVLIVAIVGVLLVSIPITRRLGRVLEEWVQMRRDGAPDRSALDGLAAEVRSLSRHVQLLDDRMQLLAERQDFTESLVESGRSETRSLPGG